MSILDLVNIAMYALALLGTTFMAGMVLFFAIFTVWDWVRYVRWMSSKEEKDSGIEN